MPAGGLSIAIDLRADAFQAAIRSLVPPKADTAVATALRQTANQGKIRAASAIAKHMGVPVRTVKDSIHTEFVRPGTYVTNIRASRKPIPLGAFRHTQTALGVQTRAWGKQQTLVHAFVATMKSGHTGIYRRRGVSRLPIRQLWGPTVSRTFTTPAVRSVIEKRIKEQLGKNLSRALQGALRRSRL